MKSNFGLLYYTNPDNIFYNLVFFNKLDFILKANILSNKINIFSILIRCKIISIINF